MNQLDGIVKHKFEIKAKALFGSEVYFVKPGMCDVGLWSNDLAHLLLLLFIRVLKHPRKRSGKEFNPLVEFPIPKDFP